MLSVQFDMTIDRQVGAPGHGKDIIDGINAVDKNYIAKGFCMTNTPEANNGATRISAESMVDGASKSFATECQRICSLDSHISGIKGNVKHSKRKANSKLKMRHYHVQDPEKVKFTGVKMELKGLPSKKGITHNGIMACYNIRTDPQLGINQAAVRRIPCACEECFKQLASPWVNGLAASNQPRYKAGNQLCKWWPIFSGLNDWSIVTTNPTKRCDESEVEELQEMLLDNLATIMAETVVDAGIGAFLTDDPEVDGYYLVKWTTTPYTLQEDVILKEYTPHIKISTGELVCNAQYFNPVPRAPYWYTPLDTPTVVRMQQVVLPDATLLPISKSNKLPNTCNKASATRLKACKIFLNDHDQILEDINRRDRLSYDEASSEEEEDDSDESASSSSNGSASDRNDDNDDISD